MILPSGDFWKLDAEATNAIAHWPSIPWNYAEYIGEEPKKIELINPETLLRTDYQNTGLSALEKYPGVDVYLWKAMRLIPACGGRSSLAGGKDCGAPNGYINVDFAKKGLESGFSNILYASWPQAEDGASASSPEISSEKISGLQLDFTD